MTKNAESRTGIILSDTFNANPAVTKHRMSDEEIVEGRVVTRTIEFVPISEFGMTTMQVVPVKPKLAADVVHAVHCGGVRQQRFAGRLLSHAVSLQGRGKNCLLWALPGRSGPEQRQ